MAARGRFGATNAGRLAPLSPLIALVGRVGLAAIFLIAGWGKLTNHAGTLQSFAGHGIQAAQAAYFLAVIIELGGGLAILLGWKTRPIAVVMAGWCIATAFVAHYQPGNVGQMIHFWKNVAMAGGFLQLVAWGAGALSLDRR